MASGNCRFIDVFPSYEPLFMSGISHGQDFHDTGPHLVKKVKRAPFGEARLGFVLTVLFICGLFPMAVYTSVLMSRTRTILENLGVKEPLGTMGQAGAPCGLIRDMGPGSFRVGVLPYRLMMFQGFCDFECDAGCSSSISV